MNTHLTYWQCTWGYYNICCLLCFRLLQFCFQSALTQSKEPQVFFPLFFCALLCGIFCTAYISVYIYANICKKNCGFFSKAQIFAEINTANICGAKQNPQKIPQKNTEKNLWILYANPAILISQSITSSKQGLELTRKGPSALCRQCFQSIWLQISLFNFLQAVL